MTSVWFVKNHFGAVCLEKGKRGSIGERCVGSAALHKT